MAGEDKQLAGFEAALTTLRPQPTGVDRDRVMFLAGQASQARWWIWPMTTTAAVLLAVFFAGLHHRDRTGGNLAQLPEQTLLVESPTADELRSGEAAGGHYFEWRDGLLARDRDAWPIRPIPSGDESPEPTLSVGSRLALDHLLDG